MTKQASSFGRQLLSALAGDLGTNAETQQLRDENARLKRELAKKTAWGERYRDMHDRAAQELSAERVKAMKVATVKCWINEDGKRFVFVSDLQEAMGVPTGEEGQ
ncbi:hypothetical protein MED01_002435 [Micromonospora sp. MED01]|uniref:hypothetical protein n=1 Tax=Micromonospora alfalfae TaxID=2911212 RepID=UPI001EE9AE5C|nr:hypothetical protein [Micromonospora alfalfae]MCG5464269.1 hypothetical protein [Micromonospora alfalfae]